MASACNSFSEDLTCSICLSVYTDPVMLKCGHWFCRKCIKQSLERLQQCPICRAIVSSFFTSNVLNSLVEKTQLKLQYRHDHETAEFLCPEHEEKLKLFCVTDQQLLCMVCGLSQQHQSHNLKPVREGATLVREQLLSLVQQISADTRALETLVQSQKEEEDRTTRRSEELTSLISTKFKEMHEYLLKRELELIDKVKSDEEEVLNEIAERLRDMESAIADNRELEAMITSALQIEDHENFLKVWAEEEGAKDLQCSFKPKGGKFQVEKTELSLGPYESHLQLFVWKEMLQVVTPREERLRLRKDHTSLMVSRDQRSATFCHCRTKECRPASAQWNSLSTQSTCTFEGQHYWEVYVGENRDWKLGVPHCCLKRNGGTFKISTSERTASVTVQGNPQKVGVYLNWPRKELSFYNAENMTHIHTESLASVTSFPVPAYIWTSSSNFHDPLVLCP